VLTYPVGPLSFVKAPTTFLPSDKTLTWNNYL